RLICDRRSRTLHSRGRSGSFYGLAHTPARFQLRSLGPRTPIRDLYLAGQDAATGGVTGAVMGGVLAASAALRRNLFTTVTPIQFYPFFYILYMLAAAFGLSKC